MTLDYRRAQHVVASSRTRARHNDRVRQARKHVEDRVDAEVLAVELAATEARFLADACRADQAAHHEMAASLIADARTEVRVFRPNEEPSRSPLAAHAPPAALPQEG